MSVVFHGVRIKMIQNCLYYVKYFTVTLHTPYEVQSIVSPSLQMRKPLTLIISCISPELLHKDGCPSIPFDPPNRSQGSERHPGCLTPTARIPMWVVQFQPSSHPVGQGDSDSEGGLLQNIPEEPQSPGRASEVSCGWKMSNLRDCTLLEEMI